MLNEWLPFQISIARATVAGACLWSLALYLGLAGGRDWVIVQLNRWFNFAERSLYISQQEFEATRAARESQNAFYASVFSIMPFLVLGSLCNYGVEVSLGRSWAVSFGLLVAVGAGVYELGRRTGASS